MRVAGTEFNLAHRALEIYLSGCKAPHCEGCHNKELWEFNQGIPYQEWLKTQENSGLFKDSELLVKKVWILGGEPLDQNLISLQNFIIRLNAYFQEIWLWTRYEKIPKPLHHLLKYAKLGMYDKTKPSYLEPLFGIKLASNNQRIVKL